MQKINLIMKKKIIRYYIMKVLARLTFIRPIFSFRRIYRRDLVFKSNLVSVKNKLFEINDALKNDGCYLGISLTKFSLEKVRAYAFDSTTYAYHNPSLGFKFENRDKAATLINSPIYISHYFNLINNAAIFQDLANDNVIRSIVSNILGPNSKLLGCQMWWTFPESVSDEIKSEYAHFYHRDLDDYKFVKFFFYITDVKEGDGEHRFIKGSHRISLIQQLREKFRIGRITDMQIYKWYGKDSEVVITGPAGSGSIEDTFGFHKGTTPLKNPRLILALVFGLQDYGYQNFLVEDELLSSLAL